MKFAQQLLLICLAGVALGCGQKGPLVMPDAQKHKRTIPAAPGAPAKPAGGTTSPAPQSSAPATSPTAPTPPPPADSKQP